MNILNIEPDNYDTEARNRLLELGRLEERSVDRQELLTIVGDVDILIVRLKHRIDRELLEKARRLKVIVSATTGLDHIDEAFAAEKGIQILSLRGETEFLKTITATAEQTWALLLSLIRKLPWAYEDVCNGYWNRDTYCGNQLSGKTLGILGYGRLGVHVARYGVAFGTRVLAYDPYKTIFPPDVFRCNTLHELLGQVDIVTLHVPLTDETVGLMGKPQFDMLQPGALLINTSRGAVVDEMALLAALNSGRLGGAGLDVLINETDITPGSHQPLIEYARTHQNLIITPHIGGATMESMAMTERFMAQKLAQVIQTQITV